MVDIVDIATDYNEKALERILNNRQQFTGISAEYCEECGCDIPEQRRQAVKGVKYCIDCQQILERTHGR